MPNKKLNVLMLVGSRTKIGKWGKCCNGFYFKKVGVSQL